MFSDLITLDVACRSSQCGLLPDESTVVSVRTGRRISVLCAGLWTQVYGQPKTVQFEEVDSGVQCGTSADKPGDVRAGMSC